MHGGSSSHMEGMDDGGGTPTMNGGFAGRERTERRLIASRFPSPLRLFGVDVNGVRDERGSPSDERGSRGVRDELGSLDVGFIGRSNPGLHGSSPRVSPPTLHETLRNVQRPEAGSLLGAQQSRLLAQRQQADAFLRLRGVMDTPAHDNFVGTMNGAGGANLATNAGGGAQPVEGQLAPAFQQLWTQQQPTAPAAADTMQMMLAMQQSMTQSMQSIQKMVEGQQKSASREIPPEARVAMEGALQGVADTGKQHDVAMEAATNVLRDHKVSTLCGKNEHRTFGSGSDAQTSKADWVSRALDIPKENSDADAKFVKVTLPLPMRWKKRDVLSRDPVPFLREVHNYALCSKQACSRMLGASLDGKLRHAYELVTERLREENHAEVSWEQAVQVFKMLVGKDLCDPEHDAMIKITRGEIKQGKEETMFEYSVKFRHNVFAAPAIPVIIVCDKFVTGMYSPEMPM